MSSHSSVNWDFAGTILGVLGIARIPDAISPLHEQWLSSRTVASALEWVPQVVEKGVPGLKDLRSLYPDSSFRLLEQSVQDLKVEAKRCGSLQRA